MSLLIDGLELTFAREHASLWIHPRSQLCLIDVLDYHGLSL